MIENELAHYKSHFANKTVLCNCDDPFESNFCKYFLRNFNVLKLRRLICTSYNSSKVIGTELPLLDYDRRPFYLENGYVLDVEKFSDKDGELSDGEIEKYLTATDKIRRLNGDGDFRSEECVEYLKSCDIVVTNPPFSLFSEFVMLLMKYGKKFLIIGGQNAITYKDIFPLIMNNVVWTGYQFGEMKFRVPMTSQPRVIRYWVDETGQKWRSLGNGMWLTNLDIELRHEILPCVKKYDSRLYPRYDNFNAINVRTIRDIPYDYPGIMGVPITIINRYNSEQFEIIGEANHGSDNVYDLFRPYLNGKYLFKRILIKHRNLDTEYAYE